MNGYSYIECEKLGENCLKTNRQPLFLVRDVFDEIPERTNFGINQLHKPVLRIL